MRISLASMLAAMADVSVTGGWDAVCAMSLDQVNDLLRQAWAGGGSGPAQPVAAISRDVPLDASTQARLDVTVGPPLLAFTAAGKCDVSMWITGGQVTVTSGGAATQVLTLPPGACEISGQVPLADACGLVVGDGHDVVVDLTSGAFSVSPGVLGAAGGPQVATAIADFFADNKVQYPLATVPFDNAASYAALTPVALSFATQSDADGNSCLLVLITTEGGTAGTATSLDFAGGAVPIPAGCSAALFVSSQALFAGVLAQQLSTALAASGGTAAGVPPASAGGAWSVATQAGGSFDLGSFAGAYGDLQLQWQTGQVLAPASGLEIGTAGGGLAGSWNAGWNQPVSFQFVIADPPSTPWGSSSIDLTGQVTGISFGLTVDDGSGTQTVEVTASRPVPSAGYTVPGSEFTQVLDDIFGTGEDQEDIGAAVATALHKPLKHAFTLDFSPFSVFALANLLFGTSAAALDLQHAYAPGDLVITGLTSSDLLVTPTSGWVMPGQAVSYSVLVRKGVATPVQWYTGDGSIGQIDENTGVYRAPAPVAQNNVDTILAVINCEPPLYGYATVNVAAPLVVSPSQAVVTPGQQVQFAASQAGVALTSGVTWQVSAGPGTAGPDGTYTAPDPVAGTQQATLTAQLGAGGPSCDASITISS
jgi:hypothetical protein